MSVGGAPAVSSSRVGRRAWRVAANGLPACARDMAAMAFILMRHAGFVTGGGADSSRHRLTEKSRLSPDPAN